MANSCNWWPWPRLPWWWHLNWGSGTLSVMKEQVELPKEHRDWSEGPLGVFWCCLCVCFCLLLGEEAGPNPNLRFLLLDEISKPWPGSQQPLIPCFCPLVFKSHTCLFQGCGCLHSASGCCVSRSNKRLVWPREPKRFAPALKRVESQTGSWYLSCSYEFFSPGVLILTSSEPLESSQENEHFGLKIKTKVRVRAVWKHTQGLR